MSTYNGNPASVTITRNLGRDGEPLPVTASAPSGSRAPLSSWSPRSYIVKRPQTLPGETAKRLGKNAPFDPNYQKPKPKQDGMDLSKNAPGAAAVKSGVLKTSMGIPKSGLILLGIMVILVLGLLFGRKGVV